MAFKLKTLGQVLDFSDKYSTGDYIVKEKKLGKYTLGEINPNGVIDIEKDMSPALKRKAVKHEVDHLYQMKRGEMRFDHNNYYYKPTPYSPIQVIPSSKIDPHDRNLPWEQDAHK
ncbi:MAG: hypothetical protein HRT86_11975 [Ilumatobacteraceae bacterium]|nr:hypothetical protein [Ilumatobacteraceae bacterium]